MFAAEIVNTTVRILSDNATVATGFLVSDDGLIATTAHAVAHTDLQLGGVQEVAFCTGARAAATVEPLLFRADIDLCILKLNQELPSEAEALPFGSTRGITGHSFTTVALTPQTHSFVKGTIFGMLQRANQSLFQLRLQYPCGPMMCGAPVVDDEQGSIVGMIGSIYRPQSHGRSAELALGTTIDTIQSICPQLTTEVDASQKAGDVDSTLRDVFICHASEDKPDVVNPLVTAFRRGGITCWVDQAEIHWGDSIIAKVEEGLRMSRYVIAVISQRSLDKPWPKRELNAALNIEASTGVVKVLPLIVGSPSERAQIVESIVLQNDKAYLTWDGKAENVVEALKRRLSTS